MELYYYYDQVIIIFSSPILGEKWDIGERRERKGGLDIE